MPETGVLFLKLIFIKKGSVLFLLITSIAITQAQTAKPKVKVIGGCEGCELMLEGMPQQLVWNTALADAKEPGEPMLISGVIYKKDGKTPAANTILYLYHTDAKGIYSPSANQKDARNHGHLRGWMKTDSNGRYQFTSIRPASYPSRNAPQHIHPIIMEPDNLIYWIDEFLFDDDPLLTSEEKSRQEKRGGGGIIHLVKNNQGVWVGRRDIILGLNVPGYQQ